jgi:Putative DNA-binding domain
MISKPFDLVEKIDIDALVADEVREGRTLEYKEKLPGNSDGEKTELLADVSSFANASGGYILYGVREKRDADGKPTGVPESVDGLPGINPDSEILRLESSIRTGIDPRVPRVRTKPIEGFLQGPVLVMWIPKSWSSPHMVTFKNHSRFYSRSSNGKYALDVKEIRSAFALSESLPERVRRFRDDRLAKIIADETPISLDAAPKIVLQLLPIRAVEATDAFDIGNRGEEFIKVLPMHNCKATDWRYNFDGFVVYTWDPPETASGGYVQVFRSGTIEAVDSRLLKQRGEKKYIPGTSYEEKLLGALSAYLKALRDFGVEPPIFVMLSFVGVKGYKIATVSAKFSHFEGYEIDRDVLLVPDILIEDYGVDVASVLHPAFDAVWRASGWERSMNYDKNGKWVGQ